MRKEVIGDCTLYLGESLSVFEAFEISADVVVADPPYGVMLGEIQNGQAKDKGQIAYSSFSDTPENVESNVVPVIRVAIDICGRAAVTTGNRCMWMYPKPDDMGVWYNPAGTGRGKWGYNLVVTPILYYGKDPRAGKGATASSCWAKADSVSDMKNIKRPCPKPLKFTKWLVDKASLEGETVLDPFMGSGTTGVACVETGRKFIGIEIEEKYFDLACERISKASRQTDMFLQPYKQEAMI